MSAPGLTLAMIMKDAAASLERCLASAAPWVDRMVIVDTGSTDNSIEIARKFGAEILSYPWNHHFAEVRNFGLKHASGDWFLILDTDEELMVAAGEDPRQLLVSPQVDAYLIPVFNLTADGGYVSNRALRLFRNRPEYRFSGALHEQLDHPELQQPGKTLPIEFPLAIRHYGYLPEFVVKQRKSVRNLKIAFDLATREPLNGFHQFNLGMEYLRLGRIEQAIEPLTAGYRLGRPSSQCTASALNHALQALRIADHREEWKTLWNEGIKTYPDYVDLWYEKALFELALNHMEQAVNAIKTCLMLGESPGEYISDSGVGTWKAWGLLGEIKLASGATIEAWNAFKTAISFNPRSNYLQSLIQQSLQLFGLKRALKILPVVINPDPSGWLQIAAVMVRQGAGKPALKLIAKLRLPDSEELRFITGLALLQSDKPAEGKSHLEKARFTDTSLQQESQAILKLFELIG
jgi:glycosyltransferase involved in cell wall biosynthesis